MLGNFCLNLKHQTAMERWAFRLGAGDLVNSSFCIFVSEERYLSSIEQKLDGGAQLKRCA